MTLVWTPGFNYDTNASAYIDAVEAADGQALETATRYAINDFVIGCKNDGIWNAIKASCILAGARTLAGALVPLAGTAPTNNNFVSGDYDRKTGLVANGSTKYLNPNRNNNADPQNSQHISVYVSFTPASVTGNVLGSDGIPTTGGTNIFLESSYPEMGGHSRGAGSGDSFSLAGQQSTLGLKGISRSSSTTYIVRSGNSDSTITKTSFAPTSTGFLVFARTASAPSNYSNARLAFYSIGESLDLALLDTRVTTLINAFAAAIP